mmetsp:Transcript_8768/g.25252  ORF Transcript_8768/g.25252 Transcript_8768/m.25252 type:complete len:264 (-) Transcript_8768:284-1075(-)
MHPVRGAAPPHLLLPGGHCHCRGKHVQEDLPFLRKHLAGALLRIQPQEGYQRPRQHPPARSARGGTLDGVPLHVCLRLSGNGVHTAEPRWPKQRPRAAVYAGRRHSEPQPLPGEEEPQGRIGALRDATGLGQSVPHPHPGQVGALNPHGRGGPLLRLHGCPDALPQHGARDHGPPAPFHCQPHRVWPAPPSAASPAARSSGAPPCNPSRPLCHSSRRLRDPGRPREHQRRQRPAICLAQPPCLRADGLVWRRRWQPGQRSPGP